MLTILPLAADHAAAAARLHILGQPGAFLTRLGIDALTVLYATLPATHDGFGYVAVQGSAAFDTVVGFVAATTSVGGLFLAMTTRRLLDFAPPVAAQIMRDPPLLPMAARTALYPLLVRSGDATAPAAELLSIMVTPEWRGHRIGALLLTALRSECLRRGAHAIDVTVDAANDGARRFYASHGFRQRARIHLNGREMCIYATPICGEAHG